MGEKNKIYLSLDDLNKIYGISKNVIDAIKKKRRKRRNKKLKKINNGTMGNKPSPSDHMVGSSSALAIATQQLNKAMIDKRIADINTNNNLMIENKKEDTPLPMELQIYNKLKNKEMLTPIELAKFQEIQNVMLPPTSPQKKRKNITRRKTFEVNPLANVSSNVMGRNVNFNNIKISDDDSAGTNTIGTSSDNFVNQNVEEFLPPIDEQQNIENPNDFFIDDSDDDVLPPIEESKLDTSIDTSVDTSVEYTPFDKITYKILVGIAGKNNVPLKKNINKKDLYNLLLDQDLIPKKK